MEHQHYVVVSLERTPGWRWGLSLSFFHSQYLIVGATDQGILSRWLRGFYACVCQLDPSLVWHAQINVTSFVKLLIANPPYATIPVILPGDCILAVNYRPIVCFDSLAEITEYMKNCNKLSLLIYRNQQATQSASLLTTKIPHRCLKSVNQIAVESLKFYKRFRTTQIEDAATTNNNHAVTKEKDKKEQLGEKKLPSSRLTTQKTDQSRVDRLVKVCFRNRLFINEKGEHSPYSDDNEFQSTTHDSNLASSQLNSSELENWLRSQNQQSQATCRKDQSSTNVAGEEIKAAVVNHGSSSTIINPTHAQHPSRSEMIRREYIVVTDECVSTSDPDEGTRANLFLRQVQPPDFQQWLADRKQQWRKTYRQHAFEHETCCDSDVNVDQRVATDFWSPQGFSSFQQWLAESTTRWKASYSWNRKKRKRIEQDCEVVVHLTEETFLQWLRVRKNQWRVLRRTRQRKRQELEAAEILTSVATCKPDTTCALNSPTSVVHSHYGKQRDDFLAIDAFLEDRERQQRAAKSRPPFDLCLLLDPSNGAPDDIVVHFLEFLETPEQNALLCSTKVIRQRLIERAQVWRSLCPRRWKLPRRPRKPWYDLYFTNLRTEKEQAKKRFDDLLSRASQILFKSDQLHTIEKMVTKAEAEFSFDINYCSGVVCERNSLINLAAIHKRHKVVRWLVETKNADIESRDRGDFTPLLNSAWAGDKYLVRFFLQKGANRKHIGTCHYTRPLAAPDFAGRTAAGWAKYRGYDDIGSLIELGL